MRRPTRTLSLLLSLALAAGLGALASTSASAAPKLPAIVSLGDSYISGEGGRWAGNGDTGAAGSAYGTDRAAEGCNADESSCGHDLKKVYGNTSTDASIGGNSCDRSDVAEILGASVENIPADRRFNLACSGALTQHIRDQSFKGEAPQVQQLATLAAKYQLRYVVLSIGGNDLEFSDILTTCATRFFRNGGYCNTDQEKRFADNLEKVRTDIGLTIVAIKNTMAAAGYAPGSYNLVVQAYPAPLARGDANRYPGDKYDRYTKGGCPFYDKDSDWATDSVGPRISAMIRQAAATDGVLFLDLQDSFVGHELCSNAVLQAGGANSIANRLPAASAEWIRWVPYLVTQNFPYQSQGHKQEAIHPNAYGQQALSTCLTKFAALSRGTATAFTCRNSPGQGTDAMSVQALAPGPQTGGPRPNGTGSLISATGYAIDLEFGDTTVGTRIDARRPKAWWPEPQHWTFLDKGAGNWQLENDFGGLEVMGRNAQDRTELVAAQNVPDQYWKFTSVGGGLFAVTNARDGKCLTVTGYGDALAVTACAGLDTQKWRLV